MKSRGDKWPPPPAEKTMEVGVFYARNVSHAVQQLWAISQPVAANSYKTFKEQIGSCPDYMTLSFVTNKKKFSGFLSDIKSCMS